MPTLREILEQPVVECAKALLGCLLVRGERKARIVEVEAYDAVGDPGCHAFRGMTPRNKVMFGPPGHAYVYFTYGMHWMLNVTAHPSGEGAAVLIRAAEPLEGIELMRKNRPKARRDVDLLSGPGKIAAAFEIDRRDYGIDLLDPRSELHILPGPQPRQIITGTRIGLAAGAGDELPWRYVDGSSLKWVSKPHPRLT
jgi:DNA-3-methyladenine glycosylase